jgi:uncharacterized protein YkwD
MRKLSRTIKLALLVAVLAVVGFAHWAHSLDRPKALTAKEVSTKLVAPPVSNGEVNTGDLQSLINQVRVQNGLGTLSDNRLLDDDAMTRAKFLCDNNQWSHDYFLVFIGNYAYNKAGENLEYGSSSQTARTIVDAWVNSPEHYANITDPVFTEQGMGLAHCNEFQSRHDVLIVVNYFGRPN